jgi:hypothetical protein
MTSDGYAFGLEHQQEILRKLRTSPSPRCFYES